MTLDVEALRAEVRALDYVRGSAVDELAWREADEDSRHNHRIEGIEFSPTEEALFAMLLEERVPPDLTVRIVLKLQGHPDADPALAITPVGSW